MKGFGKKKVTTAAAAPPPVEPELVEDVKTTSAFLSPVSRIRTSAIIESTDCGSEAQETGLPTDAAPSTLSSLLQAGGEPAEVAEVAEEEVSEVAAPKDDEEQVETAAIEPDAEDVAEVVSQVEEKKEHEQAPAVVPAPEALGLAKKIASMLRPGPPFFSEMDNSDLVGYIGDAKVMNGDAAPSDAVTVSSEDPAADAAEGHQSVWAALESLPVGAGWTQIPTNLAVGAQSGGGGGGGDDDGSMMIQRPGTNNLDGDDGLWTGLMLTCDLPSFKKTPATPAGEASAAAGGGAVELDLSGMKVELGQSVVIPTNVLEKTHFFKGNSGVLGRDIIIGNRKNAAGGSSYVWDDFSSMQTASLADPFNTINLWSWPSWVPYLGKNQPNKALPAPAAPVDQGKKRIWIPSRTKISFYATWWGYRLYLPPPVMKSLNDEFGTAANIARILSTVLSFIITHIPTGLIPPQLIPLVTVLQAIAPLTGYLSTFIAWSWSTIKSMDKGDGVVLSATWIIPVAIIPKAWDAPIVPDAPPQAPAPAPEPVPVVAPPAPPAPTPSAPVLAPAPLPVGEGSAVNAA